MIKITPNKAVTIQYHGEQNCKPIIESKDLLPLINDPRTTNKKMNPILIKDLGGTIFFSIVIKMKIAFG